MKIKMFSTILYGKVKPFSMRLSEPLHTELENDIQEWLTQNPNIKIHDIKQSMSGGSFHAAPKVIVSMFYE
ncbi:MAG: hypothetical protein GX654_16170 [Desulfatiglans sp.]|nr:hypothetical protein [Desulfatiglans sp.]